MPFKNRQLSIKITKLTLKTLHVMKQSW